MQNHMNRYYRKALLQPDIDDFVKRAVNYLAEKQLEHYNHGNRQRPYPT